MKTFIQFLTLVGELTSIYVLCHYLSLIVLALIVGGGAAVTFIAYVFVVVVTFTVIVPVTRYVFSWIRNYFDATFAGDVHHQSVGA